MTRRVPTNWRDRRPPTEAEFRQLAYEAAEWIRWESEHREESISSRHPFKKDHDCMQCRLITKLYEAAELDPYE